LVLVAGLRRSAVQLPLLAIYHVEEATAAPVRMSHRRVGSDVRGSREINALHARVDE
jgi:hypothetical protein